MQRSKRTAAAAAAAAAHGGTSKAGRIDTENQEPLAADVIVACETGFEGLERRRRGKKPPDRQRHLLFAQTGEVRAVEAGEGQPWPVGPKWDSGLDCKRHVAALG